jgi:hypothetical protein
MVSNILNLFQKPPAPARPPQKAPDSKSKIAAYAIGAAALAGTAYAIWRCNAVNVSRPQTAEGKTASIRTYPVSTRQAEGSTRTSQFPSHSRATRRSPSPDPTNQLFRLGQNEGTFSETNRPRSDSLKERTPTPAPAHASAHPDDLSRLDGNNPPISPENTPSNSQKNSARTSPARSGRREGAASASALP